MQNVDIESIDEKEFAALFEQVGEVFLGEKTVGDIKKISQDELESLYTVGHTFYSQGKFDKAANIFRFLVMYNHFEVRYVIALGGALQMLGDYEGALNAYGQGHSMDPDDPSILMHVSACFLALNDLTNATSSLNTVLFLFEDKPEHKEIVDRAKGLIDLIEQNKDK